MLKPRWRGARYARWLPFCKSHTTNSLFPQASPAYLRVLRTFTSPIEANIVRWPAEMTPANQCRGLISPSLILPSRPTESKHELKSSCATTTMLFLGYRSSHVESANSWMAEVPSVSRYSTSKHVIRSRASSRAHVLRAFSSKWQH
jgi:hypothetical protein